MKKPKKKMNVGKELVQRTKNLTEHVESVMMQRESGQTKLTYFGQHFHLSLVSGDRNPTMIISNTEETNNHVVSIDRYELKDVANFIYNYLEKNND